MVGAKRSLLNANVSSLSLLAEVEQEIQGSQEYCLPAREEAQGESVELYFSQYVLATSISD